MLVHSIIFSTKVPLSEAERTKLRALAKEFGFGGETLVNQYQVFHAWDRLVEPMEIGYSHAKKFYVRGGGDISDFNMQNVVTDST